MIDIQPGVCMSTRVVFDTFAENVVAVGFPDFPWNPGDNPKTAVWEHLKTPPGFEINKQIDRKLLINVAPVGAIN